MLLLCLFKNIGVKLVSRTDEGDGKGEEERQTEDLSSWLVGHFMQISCRCLSSLCNGRLNLFHWNVICTEEKCGWGEHKIRVSVGWCTLFCHWYIQPGLLLQQGFLAKKNRMKVIIF